MDDSQSAEIQCPYCGEEVVVIVDCSVGRQVYIEDCSVCCRPIVIMGRRRACQLVCVSSRS
jgi:hypothetical protein